MRIEVIFRLILVICKLKVHNVISNTVVQTNYNLNKIYIWTEVIVSFFINEISCASFEWSGIMNAKPRELRF